MANESILPARYIFDEESFCSWADLTSEEIEARVGNLLDLLDRCDEHDGGTYVFSQYDGVEIVGKGFVYDVLSGSAMLDRDLCVRLYNRLDHYPRWDELDGEFGGLDFQCSEEFVSDGLSAQYAVHRTMQGSWTALVAFNHGQSVELAVQAPSEVCLHIVLDTASRLGFVRCLLSNEVIDESDFLARLHLAFPELRFHPQLSFRNFSRAYLDIRGDVVKHLSALNDEFLVAYHKHNAAAKEISSAIGISVSPEGAAVHKDTAKRRARTVQFGDADHYCEWHTKIEAYQDRIYFEISDTVFVGIFAKHL